MFDSDFDPVEGSIEDVYAELTGTAKKKRKTKTAIQELRSNPEYKAALYAAQRGLPAFSEITYLEAVMFDNGEVRKRGVPRYQIKLLWTCAEPFLIDRRDRTAKMTVRYIPLAVREQARDNWHRQRRGQFSLQREEREAADVVLELAKDHDAKNDGRPKALMGQVSHRFGIEGTIRHGQLGYVQWRRDGEKWMPVLFLMGAYSGDVLSAIDRDGVDRGAILMTEGRGDGVAAYGNYHSPKMLAFMQTPSSRARLEAALAKKS